MLYSVRALNAPGSVSLGQMSDAAATCYPAGQIMCEHALVVSAAFCKPQTLISKPYRCQERLNERWPTLAGDPSVGTEEGVYTMKLNRQSTT